jgi:hypothetical protein
MKYGTVTTFTVKIGKELSSLFYNKGNASKHGSKTRPLGYKIKFEYVRKETGRRRSFIISDRYYDDQIKEIKIVKDTRNAYSGGIPEGKKPLWKRFVPIIFSLPIIINCGYMHNL